MILEKKLNEETGRYEWLGVVNESKICKQYNFRHNSNEDGARGELLDYMFQHIIDHPAIKTPYYPA